MGRVGWVTIWSALKSPGAGWEAARRLWSFSVVFAMFGVWWWASWAMACLTAWLWVFAAGISLLYLMLSRCSGTMSRV